MVRSDSGGFSGATLGRREGMIRWRRNNYLPTHPILHFERLAIFLIDFSQLLFNSGDSPSKRVFMAETIFLVSFSHGLLFSKASSVSLKN